MWSPKHSFKVQIIVVDYFSDSTLSFSILIYIMQASKVGRTASLLKPQNPHLGGQRVDLRSKPTLWDYKTTLVISKVYDFKAQSLI